MACTLAESPGDPLHRELRQLCCLRCRLDCYRVERTSSRAGVAPAEVQRLSRRTVSATGAKESIWKVANGTGTELWSGQGARVFGGPAISPDGRSIAFSVRQHGQTLLYVMQADGTNARIVTDSLDLQGAPAWAPDGQSITSAANDHGIPHLFRIPVDGRSPALFVQEYSVDPVWSPDGRFVVYSGPDIGTTFSVKAVSAEAATHPLPALTLTRGARHLAFLAGGRALVLLQGEIQHKNLWLIDPETGAERQLTNLTPDFAFATSISPQMAVSLSSNECRSARM
jgi:WD40-like Beta Propeller Repeat